MKVLQAHSGMRTSNSNLSKMFYKSQWRRMCSGTTMWAFCGEDLRVSVFQNLKRPVLSRQNGRVQAHTVTGQILEQECSRKKVPQPERLRTSRFHDFFKMFLNQSVEVLNNRIAGAVTCRTGTKAQRNRTLWNPHRRTFQIRTVGL